jgi:glycosyltransferase involved in cell wall biosynthesis
LRKGINSIGFFKENIGFSHHVRYFTRSLLRTKIPFSCKHFEFKKGDHINFEFNDYISDQLPFNVNVFSFSAPYCIEYQKKFPRDFYGRYNIGYGAWGYDKYPLNWLHQCDFLDEIWAISDFNQQVFSRYFSIPVVKIPLPVDFDVNSVSLFTRKYFNLPENKFLFLFSYDSGSDLSGRKNPIAVIKAFEKAFPANKKEAALVIKIAGRGSADDLNATKQIKQLTDLYRNRDDIIFIDKILSDREMKGLIHCIDVYVSLHRCEGFGLGMAEAMKLGKPVIATNYSGNLEFMKYNNSCLVDYTLVPAHGFEDLISGHHWAEPNIEHAAYFMKKLFNDKNYYSKISIAASSYLDENFSFVAISNKIKFRLKILGLL